MFPRFHIGGHGACFFGQRGGNFLKLTEFLDAGAQEIGGSIGKPKAGGEKFGQRFSKGVVANGPANAHAGQRNEGFEPFDFNKARGAEILGMAVGKIAFAG